MLLLEPSPAGGEPCGDGSAGESKEEVPKDVRLSSCAASSVAALTVKLDVVRKCVGRRSTGLESPSCAILQPSERRIGRTGSSPGQLRAGDHIGRQSMAPPRSLALAAPLTAQAEDEGALVSLASGGGLESAEEEGGRVQSLCRVLVPVRHLTGAIGDRRSPQVTFKSEPLSRLEPDHCGT